MVRERRVEIDPATAAAHPAARRRRHRPGPARSAPGASCRWRSSTAGCRCCRCRQLVHDSVVADVRPAAALVRGSVDVPLVDLVGCETEQLGELLDDDGVHQRLELVAALASGARSDGGRAPAGSAAGPCRAPARRAARCRRPSRRAASARPRRRTPRGPRCRCHRSSSGCHDVEHELVEALATRAQRRVPRIGRAPPRGRASPGRAGPGYAATAVGVAVSSPTEVHAASLSARVDVRAGSVGVVSLARRCSRTACGRPAVNTLTYVYADQTAVLGPLATYAEPHAYDLCELHSERLSAPRGWEVLRLAAGPERPGPEQRRPARAGRRGPRGGPPGARTGPAALHRRPVARREAGAPAGAHADRLTRR